MSVSAKSAKPNKHKQLQIEMAIWMLSNYESATIDGTPVNPELDQRVNKALKGYIILAHPELKEVIDTMPIDMALKIVGGK